MSVRDFLKEYSHINKCYLTGRHINILEPKTFEFDHIIPLNRGGLSTQTNLALILPVANRSKNDLLLDEYYQLCQTILDNKANILALSFD